MPIKRKIQLFVYRHNPDLEVLLLKRPEDRGSEWQPITGNLDRHEEVRACAVREAWEEATVEVEPQPLGQTFTYEVTEGKKKGRYHETIFAAVVPADEEIELSDEHVEFAWLAPDEAEKRLKWDEQKKALRTVAERYARKG